MIERATEIMGKCCIKARDAAGVRDRLPYRDRLAQIEKRGISDREKGGFASRAFFNGCRFIESVRVRELFAFRSPTPSILSRRA